MRPIWRRMQWTVTSTESTRVIVVGCGMQTIAIWTEARVARGMPEDGVRVAAQVLMAVLMAGRLVVEQRLPVLLLMSTVWLIALLSVPLLLVALLLVRLLLLECCAWRRSIRASQERRERRPEDARC